MTAVASFDVFDTVITRRVASPESVFLLLGRRLLAEKRIACSADAFARLRVRAEAQARRYAGGGEITLDAVYQNLAAMLGVDANTANAIKDAELSLEAALICAVPSTLEQIAKARAEGQCIVFASDMYHEPAFIKSLLEEAGAWQPGDRLFVSSAMGATKASGALFDAIRRDCGVAFSRIRHYGDNTHTDVDVPAGKGIDVRRHRGCDLSRFEQILESHSRESVGFSSLLGGASRLARLQVSRNAPDDEPIIDVAAGVIAPFLVAYVMWVMKRAATEGVSRLYFVSRDGQLMLEVARRLAPRLGITSELRYLYGSRQAWHLAAMTDFGDHEASWIFESHDYLSLKRILQRLHLSRSPHREQALSVLAAAGIESRHYEEPVAPVVQDRLRGLLTTRSPFKQLVLEQAEQARRLVTNYLVQEGMVGSENRGIVDIGWKGRLQTSLDRILASGGSSPAVGYYVGLLRSREAMRESSRRAFLFDSPNVGGWGVIPDGVALATEMFCQATHPLVTGYEMVAGRMEPVFQSPASVEAMRWGVPLVHETVCRCVDNLPDDLRSFDPGFGLAGMVGELLEEFWLRPTVAEARRWGAFPYEDDQSGEGKAHLVHPASMVDVLSEALTGKLRERHVLRWPEGCWRVSSPMVRLSRRGMRAVRRRLRGLRRFVSRPATAVGLR